MELWIVVLFNLISFRDDLEVFQKSLFCDDFNDRIPYFFKPLNKLNFIYLNTNDFVNCFGIQSYLDGI